MKTLAIDHRQTPTPASNSGLSQRTETKRREQIKFNKVIRCLPGFCEHQHITVIVRDEVPNKRSFPS